jgi:phosphotransferase system HPr-like phosphotransfer protein
MGLMSLGVPSSVQIEIESSGIDEKEAMKSLSDFLIINNIAKVN